MKTALLTLFKLPSIIFVITSLILGVLQFKSCSDKSTVDDKYTQALLKNDSLTKAIEPVKLENAGLKQQVKDLTTDRDNAWNILATIKPQVINQIKTYQSSTPEQKTAIMQKITNQMIQEYKTFMK